MRDRLLRRREVERITGLSYSSIYRLMPLGQIPRAGVRQFQSREVEGKRHRRLDGFPAIERRRILTAQGGLDSALRTRASSVSTVPRTPGSHRIT